MPAPEIYKATAWEDGSIWLAARIRGNDGSYITQSSLTAITCTVYDGETSVTTPTVTVSTAVNDTLQTNTNDARWPASDTLGFNFSHVMVATDLPNGGKVYRVEFVFDPVTGEDFPIVWDVSTLNLRTS